MAGSPIRITILANARAALANLSRVTRAVRKLGRTSAASGTQALTNSLRRLGSVARGALASLRPLGKVMGASLMGFIAVGIAAGAGQVASALVAGLAAALPAAGVIPGVALLAASAIGVLKVAMQGIVDTTKAGLKAALTGSKDDLVAYQTALKNMTPTARRTVGALVALRPAFVAIRNSVQEAFFARLSGQIAGLGRIYLPLVNKHATAVAASFNKALRGIGSFAHEGKTVGKVAKILDTVRDSVDDLTSGLPNLVRGFLPLLSVSTTFLPGITGGFEKATQRFAEFMTGAEKSGQLKTMIQGGIDALKSVGTLLGSIGSIFKSVFVDANKGGEGLFAVLGTVLSQVAAFLNSADGMAAVGAVWDTLRTVGAALGAALAVVLPALGEGLKAVAPIVGVLATAMSNFMITLAPLLPIIGQVAALFGEQLATAFDTVGPVLLGVGTAIAKIAEALLPLIPMFADVAGTVGTILVDAVGALLPVIGPLVATLSGTLAAVLPAITQAFAALAPVIAQVAAAFGTQMLSTITALAPLLPILAEAFGAILKAVLPLIPSITSIVTGLVSGLTPIIAEVTPLISELAAVMGGALLSVFDSLGPVVPIVVDAMKALLPSVVKIAKALIPLVSLAAKIATTFLDALLPSLQGLLVPAVKLIEILTPIVIALTEVGAVILEALMPALDILIPAFVTLIAWLKVISPLITVFNVILAANPIMLVVIAVAALVAGIIWLATKTQFFQKTWAIVWGGTKALFGTVATWISDKVAWLVNAAKTAWSKLTGLVDTARQMKDRIVTIFTNWLNWMLELPGKIIDGLVNGLQAGWHKVTEWISGAIDLIPQGVRDALGINSPSKVMKGLGENASGSLAIGLKKQIPAVRKAMSAVSSAVSSGVGTAAAVKVTADAQITGSGTGAAAAPITINVSVGVGADPSEAGRKIVAAIEAWQARTGRTRLVAG